MAVSLQNKVVIITGASSGFGADAARLFAREGAKVVLAARRLPRLEALADEIRRSGGEALPLVCDVTDRQQIRALVTATLEAYGRIDVLFNNAGFGRLNWLEALDAEKDIDAQLDVNLRGAIHMTQAVLPTMLAQHSGHIINMSSVAGWIAPPLYSIYSASKFGLRGFTEALRREVRAYGIRVSGIYPGAAATEFGQHTGNNPLKALGTRTDWLNMTSEHVARAVVRLVKHPWRRRIILPWWYHPLLWLNSHCPRVVDWALSQSRRVLD